MFLKNYTSEASVPVTIGRIRATLIRCGVNGITEEFSSAGMITAITFHVTLDRTYTIRLPADVESALDALWADYVGTDKTQTVNGEVFTCYPSQKKRRRSSFREQAERTAWKLQQDWVEVQMSMIQLKQADFLQTFMAYLWDAQKKQTYYQQLRADRFLSLPSSS